MKTLEKGSDKIQKICEKIKNDTLLPAMSEATAIVEKAHKEAQMIIEQAKKEAKQLEEKARKENEKEAAQAHAALSQAARQVLEALRQDIGKHLFNRSFNDHIVKATQDPEIIAKLIAAIAEAVAKEGLGADLQVALAKNISAKEVVRYLGADLKHKLENGAIAQGSFLAGAQVKVNGGHFTVDISEQALKELFSSYLNKDFRQLMFGG